MAYLISGIVLGLSAGFSPGPLLTLVITQSFRYGVKEGVRVAFSPLITDVPIVLITVLILSQLSHSQTILGGIALIGGTFVLYLACESFRTSALEVNVQALPPQSLSKGAVVNALNPHPYLFWSAVGAPLIIRAWAEDASQVVGFIAGFYVCLVGSKILIAVLAGKSRAFLAGKTYVYLMRVLAALLLIFAILLFHEGFVMLGWLPA